MALSGAAVDLVSAFVDDTGSGFDDGTGTFGYGFDDGITYEGYIPRGAFKGGSCKLDYEFDFDGTTLVGPDNLVALKNDEISSFDSSSS